MKLEKAKIRYPHKEENKKKVTNNKSRTSVYMQSFTGEYYNIKVDKLIPFKNQARKHFDEESLESLAVTIKEHGIRQPLTVLPSEEHEGLFEVISGERRLRAALKIGIENIPCIIIYDRKKAEEIAIIENIQREDLHPLELANAYNQLLNQNICNSTQEIADKLGIHKSSVVENLNLLSLREEIKDILLSKRIKSRDFLRILCKEDYSKQIDLIDNFLKEKKSKIKLKKGNGIKLKSVVLNMCINNGKIEVSKNNLYKLDKIQKEEIKKILKKLVNEITH